VGILIPLFSSIIPVLRVLGQNLNDALNYQRNRVKAIYVTILNKSKTDVIPAIIFGVMAVSYSVSIYYLLPLAFLSTDLSMMLQILFFILLGLLFGLSILAVNLQRPTEVLLTYIILALETKSMRRMVLNN
jgi:hypothetical protein